MERYEFWPIKGLGFEFFVKNLVEKTKFFDIIENSSDSLIVDHREWDFIVEEVLEILPQNLMIGVLSINDFGDRLIRIFVDGKCETFPNFVNLEMERFIGEMLLLKASGSVTWKLKQVAEIVVDGFTFDVEIPEGNAVKYLEERFPGVVLNKILI